MEQKLITQKKSERILAIDLVRGVSVLLMIPVHVMMIFSDMNTWENSTTGKIIQWIERGTPMFLVVMGISFAFSKKQSKTRLLKRACLIVALGYLLNLLRFVVPMWILGFPEEFIELNGLKSETFFTYFKFFVKGDILQLAGISLFIIALTYQFLVKNRKVLFIVTLVMLGISRPLQGIQSGIGVLDYFLDLLWADNFNVYFPVFPWMSFILIGLYFGIQFMNSTNKKHYSLFRPMFYYGLSFLAIGWGLCAYDYDYHFGDYYHLGAGGTLALMGVNLLTIWGAYFLTRIMTVQAIFLKLCFYCSKNVTLFYMIQWILVYWLMVIVGFSQMQEIHCLLTMIGVTVVTLMFLYIKDTLIFIYRNERHRWRLEHN